MGLTSSKDKKHHKKYKDSQSGKCPQAKKDIQSAKGLKPGKSSQNVQDIPGGENQKASASVKGAKGGSGSWTTKESHPPSDNHSGPSSVRSSSAVSGCSACPKTQSSTEIAEASQGNPYNPNCDDLHHIPMDSPASACCTDMEIDVVAGHQECIVDVQVIEHPEQGDKSKSSGVKKGKHPTTRQDIGPPQSDGADERSSKKDSKFPDESETARHRAFLKHEHSKGHKEFESHLRAEHSGHFSDPPQNATHIPAMQSSSQFSSSVPDQEDDAGITGQPFVKLPSRKSSPQRQSQQYSVYEGAENQNPLGQFTGNSVNEQHKTDEPDCAEIEVLHVHGCKARKNTKEHADVPVGISRLHLVKLPALQMQPIYWSPVHDEAAVTRGTWFYKETMYPIEPAVANQLESGYRELRCWSKTWKDELNSALDVGAAGEEKIVHRLWPQESDVKSKSHTALHPHLSTDPYCAARCFHGEAAAEGTINPEEKLVEPKVLTKKYGNAQVIYKDAQNAFILKPNLQPSAYYGRKPLQKIQKGTTVGIHVVRGFDWKTWYKLHPMKKTSATVKTEEYAPVALNADSAKPNACPACRSQEEHPKVTDLCLVVHGIGQKLSERMESFHFTHAMNAFRRSVTAERGNNAVQKVLRKDLGGIMVLPVNWRSNLSFEGGDSRKDSSDDHLGSDFSLNDITQPTIPAVRTMISDVMLDIPFYMSHHKPKMIQAVISEANRVYRLWCKNNPDFQKEGRVHIIAHSLGSVMAVEILSKQPTSVPKIDFHGKKINSKFFDFNTTNLFFAGSPAGFFFYLEKAKLLPRRGQGKPGAEHSDDHDKKITGEVGTYGCMAVDNVYNIMHYNDPIAYRLNATVDQQYAASLKNAQVPSATTGFFESIGNAMRTIAPGVSSSSDQGVGQVPKPGSVARLPSQLELAVHDFTREEIAEKKMCLLNDNCQVDWFLSSGGGPLEIQYINMLGAHSSYWTRPEFVRMIVTEVGRNPGKKCTLPNMRASKIGHRAS